MIPLLLSLVLLGQADLAPPKVIVPVSDQWRSFSDFYPAYEFRCHWDAKTRTWPYSAFRKKGSAGTAPAAIDYGVTLHGDRSHPDVSEVRGTDGALARELAQLSIQAGQPCPGPGPCPRPDPPDVPDPFAPDEPPPPALNPGVLIVAAGLILLSLFLVFLLAAYFALRKAHP